MWCGMIWQYITYHHITWHHITSHHMNMTRYSRTLHNMSCSTTVWLNNPALSHMRIHSFKRHDNILLAILPNHTVLLLHLPGLPIASTSYPGPFPGGQFTPPNNHTHGLVGQNESEFFGVTTSVSQQSFHSEGCPPTATSMCMSEEDYLGRSDKPSRTKKPFLRGSTQ